MNQGYENDSAYRNAVTDVGAYLESGSFAKRAWIIGAQAGQLSNTDAADNWVIRVSEVKTHKLVSFAFA